MATPPTHPDEHVQAPFAYGRIWWLGVGFLGIQLAFAVYNSFLPLLYREFLDSRALIGLLMGTDNLVGLLLIPVVGAWSDRVNSPLGRRLPFVVVGIPLAALTLFAIPFAAALLWTLIVTEVVFTAAMHLYRGPMAAMILDHTPPPRRSTSSGIAQLLGNLGVLISFAALARLYDVDRRLPFGLGAVVLTATLAVVWSRAERFPPHVDHTPVAAANPVAETVRGIRRLTDPRHRGALLVLVALLVTYVGFAGLQAMFTIYGVETLGLSEGRSASLLTAFAASFLVFALAAGMLGTRFGTIPTMLAGLATLPVLFLVAATVREPTRLAIVLALAGAAWPLFGVPAVALAADLGGRDRIGFFIGLYYAFTMTGQMIGPFVLGTSMDLFGNASMWVTAAVLTGAGFVVLRAARPHLRDLPGPTRTPEHA
jgi:MFS family permease